MNSLIAIMTGAIVMASAVAALYFMKFWRQTRDALFLLFALAFAVDAATRLALGLVQFADESVPLIYLGRLVTFAIILAAIVNKNRAGRSPN